MLVTRQPAEPVVSGKMPEKSAPDNLQRNNPVPETNLPALSSVVRNSVQVRNHVTKTPDVHEKSLIPAGEKSEAIPLAAIEPVRIAKISPATIDPGIQRTARPVENNSTLPETKELASSDPSTPASKLGSVVKKMNLWKAAEKAVSGFNYLTESRLSLVRTTDENGKFSSLTLRSEDYLSDDNVK
jgi:hypothetical protein